MKSQDNINLVVAFITFLVFVTCIREDLKLREFNKCLVTTKNVDVCKIVLE